MKPFKLRSNQERVWVKEWFRKLIINGESDYGLDAVSFAQSDEDIQRLIETLLPEQRKKLQKALSARRARQTEPNYMVHIKVSREARDGLKAHAERKGITMSELLEQTFSL
ncbi:hypothetical protein [Gilvimarinus chinensis]|uniref:hypothetical protein n=1 Tax=Gilvimarinus chinensis TaxID=396005 RepID=UPI000372404D|nr:hypothetical protein [Gilvimarinus chinensis]